MLTYRTKVPLAVEGLRSRVLLPHAEPECHVPSFSRLIQAGTHQCLADATAEPFTRDIQTDQLDRLRALDTLGRFTGVKLGITRSDAVNFCNQECRGSLGQLSSHLHRVEV